MGAVEALIAANANLELADRKKKNTPLHVACEKGFADIIKECPPKSMAPLPSRLPVPRTQRSILSMLSTATRRL